MVLRKQFARDSSFTRRNVTFHLVRTPGGLRAPSLFWLDTFRSGGCCGGSILMWSMLGGRSRAALVARRLGYPAVVTVQRALHLVCRTRAAQYP